MAISTVQTSQLSRVVAVEPSATEAKAEIFLRQPDGAITRVTKDFYPWLLLENYMLSQQLPGIHDVQELHGEGCFHWLVSFQTPDNYHEALKILKNVTGANPSAPFAPYRIFSDMQQQTLFSLNIRLFQELDFTEIRRLQFDIETVFQPDEHFPDPKRKENIVTLISMKDNTGWETCLSAAALPGGEQELLRKFIELVQERDPDVIEGHNLFSFDLSYLETRCKLHKIPFILGRNGTPPSTRSSRLTIAERDVTYRRFDIYGRHVIDTLHLVWLYDATHRDMDSHGLKYAAKYFGVNSPERTYVAPEDISRLFTADPKRLIDYCLDDARETDAISRILSPSYFYQTQIIPLSYQNTVLRGTAARIDALLCDHYLRQRLALPRPQGREDFQGGLTESVVTGIYKKVWHIDVRSLYPSVILAGNFCPRSDTNGIFAVLLRQLRDFRLQAKDAARQAAGQEKENLEALQSSLKILINSFYGYVGFINGTFNDYQLAAKIASSGREILTTMRNALQSAGAVVIEMDTDGIYFQPPESLSEQDEIRKTVQSVLPTGIEIELDATYQAMYAYKSKNYALLKDDGKLVISGAALKARSLEPFQRRYVSQFLELVLNDRIAESKNLYEEYNQAILEHRLPIADLAKREILASAPETYAKDLAANKTKRSAVYELALKAKIPYKQGQSVSYYVTGDKKTVSIVENSKLLEDATQELRDENIPFYLDKLKQLHEKLSSIL